MEGIQDIAGPGRTLGDVVSSYCLVNFNDRRKHYLAYLEHGREIWKEVARKSMLQLRSKYMFVDKSTTPYQIKFPKDAVKVYGVTVEDECKILHSILREDRMDTTVKAVANTKTCDTCGEDPTINACINQLSLRTKDVIINGSTYQEQIWTNVCANGDVVEMRRVPVQDFNSSGPSWQVIYVDQTEIISKLEVNPCGCVKKTDANISIINSDCNCPLFVPWYRRTIQTISRPYQKFGLVKFDEDKRIIFLDGDVPDQVNVTWQTNFECSENEIFIPDYATNVVTFGIHWRSSALAQNMKVYDERIRRGNYEQKLNEMEQYLDPVIMEEFMDSQMVFAKWGATGTGLFENNFKGHAVH